ncbi:hypothetical protein EWM64_g1598 [Hericium alpestre]|uniref:14-3-3 domain-containing protein n=1 Tax=Hericium alpestre TaxID=135208 RepID=A0A4Z0A815_9AGAM|nr:hypothetical protein EWM64_g1598 [Hericium alpestre]
MSPVNTQVSRSESFFLAKLAEQAERWDDVVAQLKAIITYSDAQLTVEERNLLSIAYKNITGTHRNSWRTLELLEKHESVPKDDFYESMLGQLLAKFRTLIAPLYMGADARKAALPNFEDSTKVLELFDSFKRLDFPENDPSVDRLASGDNKRKADEGMDRDLQDPTVERRSKRSRVSQRG